MVKSIYQTKSNFISKSIISINIRRIYITESEYWKNTGTWRICIFLYFLPRSSTLWSDKEITIRNIFYRGWVVFVWNVMNESVHFLWCSYDASLLIERELSENNNFLMKTSCCCLDMWRPAGAAVPVSSCYWDDRSQEVSSVPHQSWLLCYWFAFLASSWWMRS